MDENIYLMFDKLKISAFTKHSRIKTDIHNITIGPESPQNVKKHDPKKPPQHKQTVPKQDERKLHPRITYEDDSAYIIQQGLADCESRRKQRVEELVKKRAKLFEEFSRTQRREQEKLWLIQQQKFLEKMHAQECTIVEALHEYDIQLKNDQTSQKLRRQYQDLLHKKLQQEQQLELMEKHKQEQKILTENIEKLQRIQGEFRAVFQEISNLLKSCASLETLREMMSEDFRLFKNLPEKMEEIIGKCRSFDLTCEDVEIAASLVAQERNLKKQLEDTIIIINNSPKVPAVVEAPKPTPAPEYAAPPPLPALEGFDDFISQSNLKRYTEVMQFLGQYSQLFKNLVDDERLKQFRFDCKKAVNIPVNTISAANSRHLRDRYNKLSALLGGQTVSISDKTVNATKHPQGVYFCMDLLAKKFVLQGDLLVSSNPEAAFSYATVIVSLWNDLPDFGRLLLGYFYTKCPYLVPFYVPKTDAQTQEEYYVSLGYQYKDGEIEKQDKFLKRISGIMRLYFAIFIAKPKQGQPPNPHNISYAWRYFVNLIRLKPRLNITATAFHVFLETVGFEMEAVYGAQFRKLVNILSLSVMPILKDIDLGGPVARLEDLLLEYHKTGHFTRPMGVLENNFW